MTKQEPDGKSTPTLGGAVSPLATAADRLRESARWLVVTFGVLAGVVFAGISVSRFGEVDLDTDYSAFWWAVAGAGAAIVGALAALVTAMSLAAASTVTVSDLLATPKGHQLALNSARRTLAKDPALGPWENKISSLITATQDAQTDYHDQLSAWRDDTNVDADPVFVNRAASKQQAVQQNLAAMLDTASFIRLQWRFRASSWFIGTALLVSATGAIIFVWATGAEATEDIPVAVDRAVWRSPTDQQQVIQSDLGDQCDYDLDAVPVLIVGEEGDGAERDIVTVPSDSCSAVRLVVNRQELTLSP